MTLGVAAAVFPVIFAAELPDKSMFASLVMATRGRPAAVWGGAALAFAVHVIIAVSIGTTLVALLPHRVLEGVVAVLFLGAAFLALRDSAEAEEAEGERESMRMGARRSLAGAFVVIFLAEWGDLTQVLTAALAVRYHAPLEVAAGAIAALWAVTALAAGAGRLLEHLPLTPVRRLTGIALLLLALIAGFEAATGGAGLP